MSTSPSHPVLTPARRLDESEGVPQAKDAATPKVLNLAEAAALVRCSRAHLCSIVHGKIPGILTNRADRKAGTLSARSAGAVT
jgi:hypothetical protein